RLNESVRTICCAAGGGETAIIAGFPGGGALRSVTERSLSQNGLICPDVLVRVKAEPTAPAKESRVRLATPLYRCSGVSGFFVEIWEIPPAEPLVRLGRSVSRGKALPPLSAARGAEALASAVATLPPKNIRRETAISTYSLANSYYLWPGEPGKLEHWEQILGESEDILRIPFWEWESYRLSNRG